LYGPSNAAINDVLLSACESYLERYGEHLRTFLEDDTGRPRALGVSERAYARRRLSKPGPTIYVHATGAADIQHASAWQLDVNFTRQREDELSGMAWSTAPETDPTELLGAFLSTARLGGFLHGSAGRGVVAPIQFTSRRASAPTVIALVKRFVGLEVLSLDTKFLTNGIPCVNWLTLVGAALLDRVGGREAVLRGLDGEIVVHEVQQGLVFQAGPAPVSGDNHERDDLAPYRRVAEALKPLFADDLEGIEGLFTGDDDYTDAWRYRFFKGAKWP